MSSLDAARRKKSHWFLELVLVVVVALVVAAVIRAFVAQAFFIPSGSMEDTLLEDDWILVSKVGLWWGDVDRGDVVVFKDPGDGRAPPRRVPTPSDADWSLLGWLPQVPRAIW